MEVPGIEPSSSWSVVRQANDLCIGCIYDPLVLELIQDQGLPTDYRPQFHLSTDEASLGVMSCGQQAKPPAFIDFIYRDYR